MPAPLHHACLQNMYLVLVTNKASNILEDLEILRLCGKVVPEYVMPMEEENVSGGQAVWHRGLWCLGGQAEK